MIGCERHVLGAHLDTRSQRLVPEDLARVQRAREHTGEAEAGVVELVADELGGGLVEAEVDVHRVDTARELAVANPGGAYELRPIMLYVPGAEAKAYP